MFKNKAKKSPLEKAIAVGETAIRRMEDQLDTLRKKRSDEIAVMEKKIEAKRSIVKVLKRGLESSSGGV